MRLPKMIASTSPRHWITRRSGSSPAPLIAGSAALPPDQLARQFRAGGLLRLRGQDAVARGRRRVLLLVGDVGTTPLRAVFAALPPGRVTLIYRPGDLSGTGIRRELSAVAAARGNRMYYVTGTGDQDAGPLSPARLQALIPVLRCHDVYLYGAPRLAAAAITALQAAGVPRRRICLVPARS